MLYRLYWSGHLLWCRSWDTLETVLVSLIRILTLLKRWRTLWQVCRVLGGIGCQRRLAACLRTIRQILEYRGKVQLRIALKRHLTAK